MRLNSFLAATMEHPALVLVALATTAGSFYVFYFRCLHPLANYPGPLLASFTNLWKVKELWKLHLPDTLVDLHDKYGDVVRVGPNQLSFRQGEALPRIYKGGRHLAKTSFYDGFTSFNANLFGTQDEEVCHVFIFWFDSF
jgi:benzoate 4-monooxygenase